MRILNYNKAISQSIEELRGLLASAKEPLIKRRLRFLICLKQGKVNSRAGAGAAIGIKAAASEKLWKKYTTEGIQGLMQYPFKGRAAKLSAADTQALEAELRKDGISTLAQGCAFVRQHCGISYTQAGMHLVFKRLKIKKKTGRPTNVRKDKQGEKDFKKRSSRT